MSGALSRPRTMPRAMLRRYLALTIRWSVIAGLRRILAMDVLREHRMGSRGRGTCRPSSRPFGASVLEVTFVSSILPVAIRNGRRCRSRGKGGARLWDLGELRIPFCLVAFLLGVSVQSRRSKAFRVSQSATQSTFSRCPTSRRAPDRGFKPHERRLPVR